MLLHKWQKLVEIFCGYYVFHCVQTASMQIMLSGYVKIQFGTLFINISELPSNTLSLKEPHTTRLAGSD